jgi:hypothetical protein
MAGATEAKRNTAAGARPSQQTAQKWQPDQNRMRGNGAGASASTREAGGWGSGQGGGAKAGTQPSTGNVGAQPSTGNVGAGPSTGNVAARPSTGNVGGSRPAAAPSTSNFQSRSGSSSSAAVTLRARDAAYPAEQSACRNPAPLPHRHCWLGSVCSRMHPGEASRSRKCTGRRFPVGQVRH